MLLSYEWEFGPCGSRTWLIDAHSWVLEDILIFTGDFKIMLEVRFSALNYFFINMAFSFCSCNLLILSVHLYLTDTTDSYKHHYYLSLGVSQLIVSVRDESPSLWSSVSSFYSSYLLGCPTITSGVTLS